MRRRAIELLGQKELEGAVPVLMPLLEDEEASIRAASAGALGKIGPPSPAGRAGLVCRVEQAR